MRRIIVGAGLILLLWCYATFTVAQTGSRDTSQGPDAPNQPPPVQGPHNPPSAPKPPDMVCFGYGPSWSIQFVNGEARYLGVNQPDQYFLGGFYWVPEANVWDWHRENGLAPTNGYALSASVKKAACKDATTKQTYPYSAQVNLPTGDIVSGCCRKLRPGEAPIGPNGFPASENTPNGPPSPTPTAPQNANPQQ